MDLISLFLFVVRHRSLDVVLMIVLLFSGTFFVSPAYCYDPFDPNGNITIRWDVLRKSDDGSQDVRLSIINYQLYRHIEFPGWKLSWSWQNDEVIWDIWGAEATEQGDCSQFKVKQLPHCCEKNPVIIDLLPGAPYTNQVANCCKGGVISSMMQDQGKYVAAFHMSIGSGSYSNGDNNMPKIPTNFTLGLPGYTCGAPFKVPPTKVSEDQGRRWTQAFATWNVTCSYSQFRALSAPMCCVSLSAFYNETIVPCPKCSCACRGQAGATTCVKHGELPQMRQVERNEPPKAAVECSDHMCPIQVHWHVKQSYKEYWRVKMTVNNLNYVKNYSDWTLVVLHPNLKSVTQVFSFNYKPLNVYGDINDTGMFYGIRYYNDMLMQSGLSGNVQTEMLLHKDNRNFSFKEGWAFPRRIKFNGEECVMPLPDDYPRLPNFDAEVVVSSVVYLLPLLLLIVL